MYESIHIYVVLKEHIYFQNILIPHIVYSQSSMHLLKSLEGEAYTLGTYNSHFLEIVNGLIFFLLIIQNNNC